jgi:hypothetical protein
MNPLELSLMRALTHLNIGAALALLLWLAPWATGGMT